MKTQRRVISAIIAIIMVLNIIPAGAFSPDDWEYSVQDGNAVITGYNGVGGDVVIPDTIDGYTVTEIGDFAFEFCVGITSITIPDRVTRIGFGAFDGCEGLTSITIPHKVTNMGGFMFDSCENLQSVTFLSAVPPVTESNLFAYCSNLTDIYVPFGTRTAYRANPQFNQYTVTQVADSPDFEYRFINSDNEAEITGYTGNGGSITIPYTLGGNPVTSIGSFAFRHGGSQITDVTVHDNVTVIENNAFGVCTSLTKAEIGSGVANISPRAFIGCENLTEINVYKGNNVYYSVDGVLYNKPQKTLVHYPAGKTDNTYTVEDGIEIIGENSFFSCLNLTAISLPESVRIIEREAFRNCRNLSEMTIPASVTLIGAEAFSSCVNLNSLTFNSMSPPNLTGSDMFNSCSNLTTIYVPHGAGFIYQSLPILSGYNIVEAEQTTQTTTSPDVTSAPETSTATDATSTDVPGTPTDTSSSDIGTPSDTTTPAHTGDPIIIVTDDPVYDYAVQGGKLSVINYKGEGGNVSIPDEIDGYPVVNIGERAFAHRDKLISVTIPNSVISISNYAFDGCINLTGVTIGNSVEVIGVSAFDSCESLMAVIIPDSVKTIERGAFSHCSSLSTLVIGKNVTKIGYMAFFYCESLTSVIIPDSVTAIETFAFYECASLETIVFGESVERIGDGAFYNTPWLLAHPDGELVYAGNVAYIWKGSMTLNSVITLREGTVGIAGEAFDGQGMSEIRIPDSVTNIGSRALRSCGRLTEVVIPESVTEIGERAFERCDRLASVKFLADVPPVLDNYVFDNCPVLNTVYILEGTNKQAYQDVPQLSEYNIVEVASDSDFEFTVDDRNRATITLYKGNGGIVNIPHKLNYANVLNISALAFEGASITDITIPDSVTSIGVGAFANCTQLTAVNIGEANSNYSSVNGILYNKAQNVLLCYPGGKIGEYTVPASITDIQERAFSGCVNLLAIDVNPENTVYSAADGVLFNIDGTTLIRYPAGKTDTNYTVPENITRIGNFAFECSANLNSLTFESETPPTFGNNVFINSANLTTIYVPKDAKTAYEAVEELSGFVIAVIGGDVTATEETTTPAATTAPNGRLPCDCCDPDNIYVGKRGHVLAEETVSIFDALEVLKALVGMDGAIERCPNAKKASLITAASREGDNLPSIFDALEILKKLVNMNNEIDNPTNN